MPKKTESATIITVAQHIDKPHVTAIIRRKSRPDRQQSSINRSDATNLKHII